MSDLKRYINKRKKEDLAILLKTKKTAISRIENHAKDIKLSTLENFAHSIGKELKVSIA